MNNTEIRDAASIVLVRDVDSNPKVLVGQRGKQAAFMPSKFVFPGGAVDPTDGNLELAGQPDPICLERLARQSEPELVVPLLLCAVREVWEETGLRLAQGTPNGPFVNPPSASWKRFMAGAWTPSATGLVYFFRAITPPGRPRRFDARFFLGDLDKIKMVGDPDDFSGASDELANLHWASIDETNRLDLPSISRFVLRTAKRMLDAGMPPEKVPFHYSEAGQRIATVL